MAYSDGITRLGPGGGPRAGGENHTVAPGEGTLTLAGQAPTLPTTVEPSVHQLALSGAPPVRDQSRSVTVAKYDMRLVFIRGLNLAGTAPTYSIDAVGGNIVIPGTELLAYDGTLTGQAPTLDHTIVPPVGSLTLAGKTPVAAPSINPGAGSLALAGQAPVAAPSINPGVGSLTLAGQAPDLADAIVPPKGSLTLAGQAPVVLVGLPVNAGALTLTGQAPDLADAIVPTEGALTLAGQTPLAAPTINPGAGSLALAGQAPDLADAIVPPEGSLSLAGYAPSITPAIEPGEGTLALAGQAPDLADAIVPSEGALTLAGQVPVLPDASPSIPVAEGALTLTGQQAGRFNSEDDTPILVPEGSVSSSGQTPKRAAGLLLTGHEPNYFFKDPLPAAGNVSLNGKVPLVQLIGPIPVPVRPVYLVGKTPALEIDIEATEETSLGLEGWVPIPVMTSPVKRPAHGPLTLTSYIPDIPENKRPEPLVGTLALSGYAPAISTGFIPDVGSLTLASEAPAVFRNYPPMTPPVGSLTLTGQTNFFSWTISPPRLGLQFRGKVPLAGDFINPVKFPGEGSLTLSGDAPEVNIGFTPQPGEATLTLTGAAPSVEETHVRTPGRRRLTLTTYAPTASFTRIITPPRRALVLVSYGPRLREKRVRKFGGRTRIVSLTENRTVQLLYD